MREVHYKQYKPPYICIGPLPSKDLSATGIIPTAVDNAKGTIEYVVGIFLIKGLFYPNKTRHNPKTA